MSRTQNNISLLSQDLLSDAPNFTRVPGALPLQRVGLSQLRGEDRLDLAPQVLGSAGLDAKNRGLATLLSSGPKKEVRVLEGSWKGSVSELYGVFFGTGIGALFISIRERGLEAAGIGMFSRQSLA